jgi:hypothetical protein
LCFGYHSWIRVSLPGRYTEQLQLHSRGFWVLELQPVLHAVSTSRDRVLVAVIFPPLVIDS